MTAPPTVISAGYMPLDIVTTASGLQARSAGGTAANVAAILSFFGWHSILAGQAGADHAGTDLIADLSASGVEVDQVNRRPGMLTPRLVHEVRTNEHTFSYACPTCQQRFPHSRPLTLPQAHACIAAHPSATVFFFDRANPATITLATHYRAHGSVIVYEPATLAATELQRRAIELAHVVKHSDEGMVGNHHWADDAARQLQIVTRGGHGLEVLKGGSRIAKLPAFPTVVVDAAGAGDWTTAGFLHTSARTGGLISEGCLEDGLAFGQALAALSCSVIGARSLMRLTRRTIQRRAELVLTQGRLERPLRVSLPSPPVVHIGGCPTCLMPITGTGPTEL